MQKPLLYSVLELYFGYDVFSLPSTSDETDYTDGHHYGWNRQMGSPVFRLLRSITKENVSQLEVGWTYYSTEMPYRKRSQLHVSADRGGMGFCMVLPAKLNDLLP